MYIMLIFIGLVVIANLIKAATKTYKNEVVFLEKESASFRLEELEEIRVFLKYFVSKEEDKLKKECKKNKVEYTASPLITCLSSVLSFMSYQKPSSIAHAEEILAFEHANSIETALVEEIQTGFAFGKTGALSRTYLTGAYDINESDIPKF